MKKDWPVLKTDEESERFVAEEDLTEHAVAPEKAPGRWQPGQPGPA